VESPPEEEPTIVNNGPLEVRQELTNNGINQGLVDGLSDGRIVQEASDNGFNQASVDRGTGFNIGQRGVDVVDGADNDIQLVNVGNENAEGGFAVQDTGVEDPTDNLVRGRNGSELGIVQTGFESPNLGELFPSLFETA
jgi:hypothetical protein